MLSLVQVRECDGECCKESPRFPNLDHSDCIYHSSGDLVKGCKLMQGIEKVPDGQCPVLKRLTAQEAFDKTCDNWPHNTKPGKDTGDCCWRWVDNG